MLCPTSFTFDVGKTERNHWLKGSKSTPILTIPARSQKGQINTKTSDLYDFKHIKKISLRCTIADP